MIHEAYMPVYMGSRFLARTDGTGRTGPIKGSTRGPRGPKNNDNDTVILPAYLPKLCDTENTENTSLSSTCLGIYPTCVILKVIMIILL